MKMDLVSYNGNAFSPDYQAWIVYPRQLRMEALPNILPVAGTYGQYTGKSFGGGFLTIQVKYLTATESTQHTYEAEIARWFSTLDVNLYKLLAQDTADSNRQWYVNATPVSVVQENDSAVIVLALEKPYWSVETASTDTWTITASGQTKNISVLGERAKPILTITPNNAKSASGVWGYSRFVHVQQPYDPYTPVINGPFPVNLGPFNTATLVSGGKAQADGDDFRVQLNGTEIPRWFGTGSYAFNQATTNIWIVLPHYKTASLQLLATVPATAITEIAFKKNAYNKASLEKMALAGQAGLICINSGASASVEYFNYTGIDLVNYKLTGITRAAKGTTARSHVSGLPCIWIPYDITVIYGNSTATAPSYDDSQKPMFNLNSSTNASWVFEDFLEDLKQRTGGWVKSLISSSLRTSTPYTGPEDTTVNPASEMGLKMATGLVSGVEQAEAATIAWTLHVPHETASISITGQKYRETADWPTVSIQKSTDSVSWTNVISITSPSASGGWEAISESSAIIGKYVRFLMTGNLAAGAGNKALAEISDLTLSLDTDNEVDVFFKTENSAYYLDAIIENVTTGEWIRLVYPMKTGNTLVVDCQNKTVTYVDGTNALQAITLSDERPDWFNFVYGTNQIKYTEGGVANLTIDFEWVDEAPV